MYLANKAEVTSHEHEQEIPHLWDEPLKMKFSREVALPSLPIHAAAYQDGVTAELCETRCVPYRTFLF